jgi:glycosyltransferase involved in cell wall biosynthesis
MATVKNVKSNEIVNGALGLMRPPKPPPESEIISQWRGSADNPLVSIQCITYNHAPYIEDALNGFLMQKTTFPFEIWIHDDASSDGTREIVERYQAVYPKIIKTIFQVQNQYSKGIRAKYFLRGKCKGKYYALCEGDDYWVSSEKIQKQFEALEEYPESHIAVHPGYMWDVRDNKFIKKYFRGNKSSILDVSNVAASLRQYCPTASYFFKASEMEAMPDWFFEAKDLPFGDYFRETILGRNGLVYTPHFYSVYRRNVPGSYTVRTSDMSPDHLIGNMKAVLYYTSKLFNIDEIPKSSIRIRRRKIYLDYLSMALQKKSFEMYLGVINLAEYNKECLSFQFSIARHSVLIFHAYVYSYRILSPSIMVAEKLIDKIRYPSIIN